MSDIYAGTHLVGGMTADWWSRDPQRMAFVAARYKFVAKMFAGYGSVLEVGCADGFGARIVRQRVQWLTGIDIDGKSIQEAMRNQSKDWPVEFSASDFLLGAWRGFNGVYALDVLEHMRPGRDEEQFLNCLRAAAPVCIIGTPSLESQPYASELSKAGHVNCKTEFRLGEILHEYWNEVFLFGMNDETLHTGFGPMSHYRLALCVA